MMNISTTLQQTGVLRLPLAHTALKEIIVHTLLLLVVIGSTIAGYNHPAQIVIQADSQASDVFDGFHSVEYSAEGNLAFRWTGGAGSICIQQVGYAPLHAIQLTLLGKGANALGNNDVAFMVNGQTVTTARLRPAVQTYTFLVGGDAHHSGDLCVTIASDAAYAPSISEQRRFGVPFHELVLYRNVSDQPVLPAQWQLGLNLAAALVACWLLRLLGVWAWLSALTVALVALAVGTSVATGVLSVGIAVTQNTTAAVGVAAVLLAGVVALREVDGAVPDSTASSSPLPNRLKRDLLHMGIWSVLLWGGVHVLQGVYGHSGVWPLKAGVWPNVTPLVLIAVAAFALWLWLVFSRLRQLSPRVWLSLVLILAGAILLPVLLKVSVRGWDSLYYTFTENPADYIQDVPLVGDDPIGFLGRYVELSPVLAWHNSNHPPGSVLLLWIVDRLIGSGPVLGSWVAIILSGFGAVAAYWLGSRIGRDGAHLALLAGCLYVVMPGHQAYSVTSMDGVFNALNALAAVAFFLALEPGARVRGAVLAGVLIALGLFFTYATTQLFFFGVAVCLLALVRGQPLVTVLRQGAIAAGTLVLIYLLLYLATGFNVLDAVVQAKANNARAINADVMNPDPELVGLVTVSHYVRFLGINIVPFAWYLAPWGLAALTPIVIAGVRGWRHPSSRDVLAISLVILVVGMLLSGLFIREVERIWGFVYPLAAVLIAMHAWQGETQREKLRRAGLYISLFFAQSVVMRVLLNLYW